MQTYLEKSCPYHFCAIGLSLFFFLIFMDKPNEVVTFNQASLSYHLLICSSFLKMRKSPLSRIVFSEFPRDQ